MELCMSASRRPLRFSARSLNVERFQLNPAGEILDWQVSYLFASDADDAKNETLFFELEHADSGGFFETEPFAKFYGGKNPKPVPDRESDCDTSFWAHKILAPVVPRASRNHVAELRPALRDKFLSWS